MNFSFSSLKYASILLISVIATSQAWASFEVRVSEAPDNDLALALSAIKSAKQTLSINIYELDSPEIVDAIIAQVNAGVQVQILQEGQPVGGIPAAARGLQGEIVTAMKRHSGDFLHEMTSKAGPRRFRFDHAKYTVVDGVSLLVGSENYSPTGTPVPGTQGNRGWEVWINDSTLAKQFETMFNDDSDLKHGDMLDLTGSGVNLAEYADYIAKAPKPRPPTGDPAGKESGQTFSVTKAVSFRSPDTSLSGLVSLIQSAKQTLDIEQMTFESQWDQGTRSSPVFDAVVAAKKRGVQVRVLLNDESVFSAGAQIAELADDQIEASKPKNVPTVQAFNKLGIQAKIANLKAMGVKIIHNKGAVVDGHLTLISSINWGENAITHNRETAVVLDSTDVYGYYEGLFNQDWERSGGTAQRHSLVETQEAGPVHEIPVTDCPAQIQLQIQVGQLQLELPRDESFEALSNATFQGQFNRTPTPRGEQADCILSNGGREYIQVRERSDGEKMISMEGYTLGSKIYIIRALNSDGSTDGTFNANVINGSGARNPVLGTAVMKIQASQ